MSYVNSYWNTPMTRLDALNICLSSIGEAPVNSLESLNVDAMMALNTVEEITRQVEIHGWHWNKEVHVIEPDVNGYLILPANTASIRTTNWSPDYNLVQRGLRLFDTQKNTYQFDRSVECELYVFLPFEDLIGAAQEVIAYRAAMVFQERIMGSGGLDTMLAGRYAEALANLKAIETRNTRPNMLRDNASTSNILNRGFFSRGLFR